MNRMLVFTLVASLGSASLASAGETLLSSATRIAREAARREISSPPKALGTNVAMAEQSGTGLATTSMSRRSKIMIAVAAAAGFAITAYTIDQKVLNNTPSSLGTRKD